LNVDQCVVDVLVAWKPHDMKGALGLVVLHRARMSNSIYAPLFGRICSAFMRWVFSLNVDVSEILTRTVRKIYGT
jgi:hypothetical protein